MSACAELMCLEGVEFSVRPPNKSWKRIANLSGGEKTLSSLSLIFALHYYRPTPVYVMDEIDAALGQIMICFPKSSDCVLQILGMLRLLQTILPAERRMHNSS